MRELAVDNIQETDLQLICQKMENSVLKRLTQSYGGETTVVRAVSVLPSRDTEDVTKKTFSSVELTSED